MQPGRQVCQECEEPVLGSALPGIRGREERNSLPAEGQERQGGRWERGLGGAEHSLYGRGSPILGSH